MVYKHLIDHIILHNELTYALLIIKFQITLKH
jgi:hypothetical protein